MKTITGLITFIDTSILVKGVVLTGLITFSIGVYISICVYICTCTDEYVHDIRKTILSHFTFYAIFNIKKKILSLTG